MNPSPPSIDSWGALRARRIAVFVAAVAWLPLTIGIGGASGFPIASLILLLAIATLRSWRCPRCNEAFAGVGARSWPDACVSCGLPAFGSASELAEPVVQWRADSRRLPPRFRRVIAGGEVAAGVGAMALSAVYATRLPWWYITFLEGLGGLSIFAGWLLWNDKAEGYRITRILQLAELVKLQGSLGAFAVACGFEINAVFTDYSVGLSPGIVAKLTLIWGSAYPFQLSINLLAAVLLFALWGAQDENRSARVAVDHQASSVVREQLS